MRLIDLTVQLIIDSDEMDEQLQARIEAQLYDLYKSSIDTTRISYQLKTNSIEYYKPEAEKISHTITFGKTAIGMGPDLTDH